MKRSHFSFLIGLLLFLPFGLFALEDVEKDQVTKTDSPSTHQSSSGSSPIVWAVKDAQGELTLQLYFFWSAKCPHCTTARPIIENMSIEIPWLQLHSYPVSDSANRKLYQEMANALGQEANSVPGFIFCGTMLTGFNEEISPGQLEEMLRSCYELYQSEEMTTPVIKADDRVNIPGLGVVDVQSLSLPILTVVLAALDSFNPCAFFVLLFLLSLLVHARNRKRMVLIGGLYITVSGSIYFLFMAAWLNLFMLIGDASWITTIAGIIAVIIAIINIKDFFWFHQGVTLSIPESAKPGLFQRMRSLLSADSLPAMVTGTIILAVVANSYELLCTAGFPMVYTRALTLHELTSSQYYLYLLFYNLIYVIPLLVITLTFIYTLGSRKLKEREGRALKLMSGMMMLGLGLLLVIAPELLNNLLIAVALLSVALLVTALVLKFRKD